MKRLTVWCNGQFEAGAARRLEEGLAGHRLVYSSVRDTSVLAGARPDGAMAEADIAFGQPDPGDCLRHPRIRWVQLTSAGYTRYDTPEFLDSFRSRGAALTKSSVVFAEPVAEHGLAMILALDRNLLPSHDDQKGGHDWRYFELRGSARLLKGRTVLFLGFGAIARRMVELLSPFGCECYAIRRQTKSERGVRIVPEEDLTKVLPLADHVVNVLPASEATRGWVNARRLSCLKPGARLYNLGRGATVDQSALVEALRSGRLGAAYLDVTDPEPLPPEHPLWTTPNCHLTAHTAGGWDRQDDALVEHFLANFAAFTGGGSLSDRVV